MNPKLAPQYLEHCAECDHVQAWHIATCDSEGRIMDRGPFLHGRMVACRFPGCKDDCRSWQPTWGVAS